MQLPWIIYFQNEPISYASLSECVSSTYESRYRDLTLNVQLTGRSSGHCAGMSKGEWLYLTQRNDALFRQNSGGSCVGAPPSHAPAMMLLQGRLLA